MKTAAEWLELMEANEDDWLSREKMVAAIQADAAEAQRESDARCAKLQRIKGLVTVIRRNPLVTVPR